MEAKEFIEKFAEQFEDTDDAVFELSTNFKDIDEWDSLIALSVIAMIDEEYQTKVKGEDIKNSNTIEDLYNLVKSKK